MRTSVVLAAAAWSLAVSSVAIDPAQWEPIGRGVMDFAREPLESTFRSVESKVAALPAPGDSPADRASYLNAAAFLSTASHRHGWTMRDTSVLQALEIAAGKGPLAAYLANDEGVDLDKLDVWWVCYYGSQDESYLDKLLRYAGSTPPADDLQQAALIEAVTWSFLSNCEHIPTVRAFAKRRLSDPRYKESRDLLQRCIGIQCPLHHLPMQRSEVPVQYGLVVEDVPSPALCSRNPTYCEFLSARDSWPNASRPQSGGCVGPEDAARTALVYVCSACNAARSAWVESDPRRARFRDQGPPTPLTAVPLPNQR